jgi:mannose-6-phosphate isomerase-like protein (cupin superfamily)
MIQNFAAEGKKKMHTFGRVIVLTLVGAVVAVAGHLTTPTAGTHPQPATPPQAPASAPDAAVQKTYTTAAEVQALLAKAKGERKEGHVAVAEHILSLAPYNANLEYRPVDGAVAVHEKEAEMVYVIDGGGTLTTGGKVVGEKRTNAANLSGTAIDGGTTQALNKGDFAIIPEGTPHQFKPANGMLVLMTLHVARPVSEMQ